MANFRVIEGGGERRNPKLDIAEQELADAVREAAANVLRIIRGAGSPGVLIRQFVDVLEAATDFREVAGHGVPARVLASVLAMDNAVEDIYDKEVSGLLGKKSVDRWEADGTLDRAFAEILIQRGALQIIASKMLDQSTQVSAGETELHDGIRGMISAREKAQKVQAARFIKAAPKKRDRKPPPPKPDRSGAD